MQLALQMRGRALNIRIHIMFEIEMLLNTLNLKPTPTLCVESHKSHKLSS